MHRQALELAVCSRDPVHWCNTWGWTYDPRTKPTTLPFNLFPKQAKFLTWLAAREARQEDGLVEKSREVGASWLCCVYALHGWLFREGFQCGFGSRKLEYVDVAGDPKSVFEKLRVLLSSLPAWMLPPGWRWKDHSCYCRLLNPHNGATITGEGGDNIGRGGRSSIYFVDEAAYLERPQLVDRALSQTTRCRIDVSTPNGPGNPFHTKRFSGRVEVFTLHWRDDPRKDEAWYGEQKRRFDPVTVAQEIDISYTASIEGITIPATWVRAAVGLQLPASGPIVGGYDVAEEGRDVSVLMARQGPVVLPPVAWGQVNTTEGSWKARDEAVKLKVSRLNFDAGGPGMGVKGTWTSAQNDPRFDLGFHANPVNFGGRPTEARWPDGQSSVEKFVNLRAEMWWRLRARFEKAYEFVEQGVQHRPEDMISIPDCPQLIAELSQPLSFRTEMGKVVLESKKDMARRGVKSPDYGDALALCFLDAGLLPFNVTVDHSSRSAVLDAPRGVYGDHENEEGGIDWDAFQP